MTDFYLLDVIGGGHNKPSLNSQTDPHPSPPRTQNQRASSSMQYTGNPLASNRSSVHNKAHLLSSATKEF